MAINVDFLKERFAILVETFNNGSEVDIENVNYETGICCFEFLKAGFDADQVVKMLFPEFIWENYHRLISYGATIDVTELVKGLDRDFIEAHWEKCVDRGANVKDLVDSGVVSVGSGEVLVSLFDAGVDAETCFQLMMEEGYIHFSDGRTFRFFNSDNYWPEEIAELFSILRKHGLSTDDIKTWVDGHLDDQILFDIIEYHSEEWEKIGIHASDYFEEWMKVFGEDYLYGVYYLKDLPKNIPLEKFIDYYSGRKLFNAMEYENFNDGEFIKDYIDAGGDIELLAKKVVDEVGYSNAAAFTLAHFLNNGAKCVDATKVADCMDPNDLDESEVEWFLTIFRSNNVPEEYLFKFLS